MNNNWETTLKRRKDARVSRRSENDIKKEKSGELQTKSHQVDKEKNSQQKQKMLERPGLILSH